MPTYDYKCNSCNYTFEALQSIKDEPLTKCPKCGKKTLKKLISSGAGFILKGSGFYLTDYKNKHSKKSTGKTIDTTTKDTTKHTEKKVNDGKTHKDK
jgi:putative FmdB family regulatory protein